MRKGRRQRFGQCSRRAGRWRWRSRPDVQVQGGAEGCNRLRPRLGGQETRWRQGEGQAAVGVEDNSCWRLTLDRQFGADIDQIVGRDAELGDLGLVDRSTTAELLGFGADKAKVEAAVRLVEKQCEFMDFSIFRMRVLDGMGGSFPWYAVRRSLLAVCAG